MWQLRLVSTTLYRLIILYFFWLIISTIDSLPFPVAQVQCWEIKQQIRDQNVSCLKDSREDSLFLSFCNFYSSPSPYLSRKPAHSCDHFYTSYRAFICRFRRRRSISSRRTSRSTLGPFRTTLYRDLFQRQQHWSRPSITNGRFESCKRFSQRYRSRFTFGIPTNLDHV